MQEKEIISWLKKNKPELYYIHIASKNMLKKKKVGAMGKLFAESNEYIQRDWINKNTELKVIKRDDKDSDLLEVGYDLRTVDGVLKIQSKLRYGQLMIEPTRRPNKNQNGDVTYKRYSIGEADVYLFSKPKSWEQYTNIKSWEFVAIPEKDLIDSKNSGYLVKCVPMKVWNKYVGKTKEVLERVYKQKSKRKRVL
jgi:hypothetical protein